MDAFFACEGLLCLAKQHNYGFDVLDDNAHTLRIYDLPSEYMSPNNVDDAIFSWNDTIYHYATNDGMLFGLPDYEYLHPYRFCTTGKGISVIIDVNGAKKPNTASKDLHKYRLCWPDDNSTFKVENIIISQIKPIAIFRYFSVYYPLLIIFTVTLPLCLPQIHYKKAFVTLFLICFTSAQTGNTYLANEDLVTYNIQALLMNTENPALVKYRREKRYKHLKLHTDHAFFFGDAADKGINEGETIYFAVRPCDYLHKLEILGTKFNLQRIETSNKCYYLFRLQRREAL